MTRSSPRAVYVGIKGRVVAIDAETGAEIWRTKLEFTSVMTLALAQGRLFAGVNGQLYCLDPANGEVIWCSRLKGLGLGFLAIASTGQQGEAIATLEEAAAVQTQQNATNSVL